MTVKNTPRTEPSSDLAVNSSIKMLSKVKIIVPAKKCRAKAEAIKYLFSKNPIEKVDKKPIKSIISVSL